MVALAALLLIAGCERTLTPNEAAGQWFMEKYQREGRDGIFGGKQKIAESVKRSEKRLPIKVRYLQYGQTKRLSAGDGLAVCGTAEVLARDGKWHPGRFEVDAVNGTVTNVVVEPVDTGRAPTK